MSSKRRLSASIDADLMAAAEAAVQRGAASSVSAWVNEAFRRQLEHDRRLAAMDVFLATFEAEFGEITDEDIAAATKRTRADATVVRSKPPATPRAALRATTRMRRRSA